MTNSVTFDTSGAVEMRPGEPPRMTSSAIVWPDLSPFCQGFIEAAFASLREQLLREASFKNPSLNVDAACRFDRLHPSTLARFMEDCAEHDAIYAPPPFPSTASGGRAFWLSRQNGFSRFTGSYARPLKRRFPPLRLYLSPDGKVMAEEVSKEIAK
jgi:hypothetical protein